MCHAAKSIVLGFAAQWISVSGRCWEGKALKRNWSFGRTDTKPIQDRYESGVCCANPCKTDTGKKLVVGRSALQQNPRSAESVPNKSASSYIYIYIQYIYIYFFDFFLLYCLSYGVLKTWLFRTGRHEDKEEIE